MSSPSSWLVQHAGLLPREGRALDVASGRATRLTTSRTLQLGTFSADSLQANLGQRTVVLGGRARLHIRQKALR